MNDGYDVALLRLPQNAVTVLPVIADESINIYPNAVVHALKYGRVLEMGKFVIVANKLCPMMENLSDDMFCIYSEDLSAHPGGCRFHGVCYCWDHYLRLLLYHLHHSLRFSRSDVAPEHKRVRC